MFEEIFPFVLLIAITLLVRGGFAYACYRMAVHRDRSKVGWAIAGFIFGLFAILILAILGEANDVETIKDVSCPHCRSLRVEYVLSAKNIYRYDCNHCEHMWEAA